MDPLWFTYRWLLILIWIVWDVSVLVSQLSIVALFSFMFQALILPVCTSSVNGIDPRLIAPALLKWLSCTAVTNTVREKGFE